MKMRAIYEFLANQAIEMATVNWLYFWARETEARQEADPELVRLLGRISARAYRRAHQHARRALMWSRKASSTPRTEV
jgi:hypothetical protein